MRKPLDLLIIGVDCLVAGILPLIVMSIVYISLLTSPYHTWLPESLSSEQMEAFLYVFVPAELFSITLLGVFACGLQIPNILVLIGTFSAWRGSVFGAKLLIFATVLVNLIELIALLLYNYIGFANWEAITLFDTPILTRILSIAFLIGINIWYYFARLHNKDESLVNG